jgi:CHAT domain-containing protein
MLLIGACRRTSDADTMLVANGTTPGLSNAKAANYSFELQKDEFFSVLLQKAGSGVAVSVLRPDGAAIGSVGCTHEGPVSISGIASIRGRYSTHLRSCRESVLSPYQIALSVSAAPTDSQRQQINSQRLIREAAILSEKYTLEDRQKAILGYEAALREKTILEDGRQQYGVFIELAELYRQAADFHRALQYIDQALAIQAGDVDRSQAFVSRATILLAKGKTGDAETAVGQGLDLARSSSNRLVEAKALYVQGLIHYEKGSYTEATRTLRSAADLFQGLGDDLGGARASLYLAAVAFDLRHFDIARQTGDPTLAVFKGFGDRQGETRALTFLGHFYSALNRKQEALNFYDQARALVVAADDAAAAAPVFNGIARVHFQLGDPKAASQFFQLALERTRLLGNSIDTAYALRSLGQCEFAEGDFKASLASLHEAHDTFAAIPHKVMQAVVLMDIGSVLAAQGKTPAAVDYLNRALDLSADIGHAENQARALLALGEIREKAGDINGGLTRYQKALGFYDSISSRLGRLTALNMIANAERALGKLDDALAHSNAAVAEIEKLRASVANPGLRTSYFASVSEQYELSIDILMKLYERDGASEWATKAFNTSERSRARALLESIAETRATISVGVDPKVVERETTLRNLWDATAERYDRLVKENADPKIIAELSDEIRQLTAENNEVDGQIRSQSPRYAALVQPEPLTLAAVQTELLDDNTRLLEYVLGENASYVWLITKRDFLSFALPKRSEIERRVLEYRDLITARVALAGERPEAYQVRLKKADAEYPRVAAELSRMLLGPVAEHLGDQRLAIVADGALQYLPFGALPTPASLAQAEPSPLIVQNEIVRLPSASTLAVIRKDTPAIRPDLTLAVFADPVFEWTDSRVVKQAGLLAGGLKVRSPAGATALPRLVGSKREAESILELVPGDSRYVALGFDARKKAVMEDPELRRFRILHFATHTRLVDDHPELSSLLLSLIDRDGNPQDGYLRLRDMYNLKIGAELVVLSACETALGKEIKGEGMISMVRGFMYSGTPRVLASLWKVDDEATAELMKEFYTQLLRNKLTAVAALRQAQIKQMAKKSFRSPFYWAGFQLQGEWK